MGTKKLTILQAFNTMRFYLEKYYQEAAFDDFGSLLGDFFSYRSNC